MWYNVDILKLGAFLIPPFLRKKKLIAFFGVFLEPFIGLAKKFKAFRKASNQKLNVNGQVIYIEKRLCDEFELEYPYIYITDSDETRANIADMYADQTLSMAMYPLDSDAKLYLESGNESDREQDYIVHVPSFLSDKLSEIRTIVEYHRPAGRKFEIKVYDYE